MMPDLSEERREALRDHLIRLFSSDFDETLTEFRADAVIDLMLKTLGPTVYNQAVQDVRQHLQIKLDDLDGEIYLDSE
ncbi:MAG: hypothetical protein CME88_18180 [Hirschia sp.]|nr:hypothetical protein [Hirschia sp.]MBF18531.1 hypothetical protein [Hirschia sp.]MBF20297.1 hypothetical protein [Hirschia sp.]|tara:strand:- start:152 stop:385 length:234 start_codon:yes stop_codon:yes gene_type:complete